MRLIDEQAVHTQLLECYHIVLAALGLQFLQPGFQGLLGAFQLLDRETLTAAVYEYLVDNDGGWGELRFDFENGTAEIVKLADCDTVKSNVFAKAAIRFVQDLPEAGIFCKINFIPTAHPIGS